MPDTFSDHVPSPCVQRCQLDADGRYCLGCRRTRDEIATWSTSTPAQQRAVWARLIAEPLPADSLCPRCGAGFSCGSGGQAGGCWCADLPQVLPPDAGGNCLCPSCLREHLADAHRQRGLPPPAGC